MVPNSYIIYESEEGMMKMAETLEQVQMCHLSSQKFLRMKWWSNLSIYGVQWDCLRSKAILFAIVTGYLFKIR